MWLIWSELLSMTLAWSSQCIIHPLDKRVPQGHYPQCISWMPTDAGKQSVPFRTCSITLNLQTTGFRVDTSKHGSVGGILFKHQHIQSSKWGTDNVSYFSNAKRWRNYNGYINKRAKSIRYQKRHFQNKSSYIHLHHSACHAKCT